MHLKTLTSIFILISISLAIQAQETTVIYEKRNRNVQTLFSSDGGFGGHLSINAKGTEIYNESALLVGTELVFTLNHSLNIGVAGYGMPTRVEYQPSTDLSPRDDLFLELGYGGLFFEPVFFDEKLVHLTLPIIIGGGWAGVSNFDYFDINDDYDSVYLSDESLFFMIEPGVNLEVNLARNVRFTLGGSYRFVNGSDIENVSDDDLGGLALGAGIRVGWF
ncbi:MAG: hypothetical protein AAGC47_04290 [Bacteroidota bacterium]